FQVHARLNVCLSFVRQLCQMEEMLDCAARPELVAQQDLVDEELNSLRVEWLLQEVCCSEFHGLDCVCDRSVRGQNHDCGRAAQATEEAGELKSTHLRHLQVDESDVVVLLLTLGEGLLPIPRSVYCI